MTVLITGGMGFIGLHTVEAFLNAGDTVVATYMGDGATSQGEVHEAMNFASVQQLPVVFIVENNKYAISVPQHKQMNITRISDRAIGYGMPGVTVDGTDVAAVYEVTEAAAARARAGEGPTLIEVMVERFRPHTGDDDHTRYRSAEELEAALKRDPIKALRSQLMKSGELDEAGDAEIADAAMREIDEATDFAEAAPLPDPATFYDHVYAD